MPVLIIEYNDNHKKGCLDEKARFSLHLYFFSIQLFFCTVAPKKRDEINNKSNALGIAAQQECCKHQQDGNTRDSREFSRRYKNAENGNYEDDNFKLPNQNFIH